MRGKDCLWATQLGIYCYEDSILCSLGSFFLFSYAMAVEESRDIGQRGFAWLLAGLFARGLEGGRRRGGLGEGTSRLKMFPRDREINGRLMFEGFLSCS